METVEQVAKAIVDSTNIVVFTGAGMSADSGLPTYRGIGGLYNQKDSETGLAIEEILHAETFARDPAITWRYIAQIDEACMRAGPNIGHEILANWERRFPLTVITQNVDGFHVQAGSTGVIEIHGSLRHLVCCRCGENIERADLDLRHESLPPSCSKCGGVVRPRAVLFGEMLPQPAVAAYDQVMNRQPDLLIAIGTTAGFPYIHEPFIQASRSRVTSLEINLGQTLISEHVTHRLEMPAAEALQAINQALV